MALDNHLPPLEIETVKAYSLPKFALWSAKVVAKVSGRRL